MVHPGCLASALFCGLWRQERKKDGQVVCVQSQSSADVIMGVTIGHSRMPLEIQPSLPLSGQWETLQDPQVPRPPPGYKSEL